MSRFVFFISSGDHFTNPTLISVFKMLLQRDVEVIVFAGALSMDLPDSLKKIKVFPVSEYPGLGEFRSPISLYYIYRTIRSFQRIKEIIRNSYHGFLTFYRIKKHIGRTHDLIIVGNDPKGLIMASQVAKRLNKPKLGYFSFEILFWKELPTDYHHQLKKSEIKASLNLNFCLIQDHLREALLRKENRFNQECRFFHVPVSPLKSLQVKKLDASMKKMLNVILTGTIVDRNGYDEVLNIVETNWDRNYNLVCHSPVKLNASNSYGKKIANLHSAGFPVSLNDEPIPEPEKYYAYLCQFDIGLSLYLPYKNDKNICGGKNVEIMGLSSGRFSTFMMLGIPTITTENEILEDLNKRYQFGIVIKDIKHELQVALDDIRKNYARYHRGALRLYDERLNPEKAINSMLDLI